MTPTSTTASPPGPAEQGVALRANIRAEIARSGRRVEDVRIDLRMSESTWQRRNARPTTWPFGELVALAGVLGVPLRTLVP